MTDQAPDEKPKKKWRRPLDAEHREARAGLIMAAKLANKRTEEIMAEFNLSRATVYRALSDARKMGLLTQARDWLTLSVVPLSLAAIEEALLHGELPLKVDTAFRVLDGLGVTGKHAVLTVNGGAAEESFDEFRATVIRRIARPAAPAVETVDASPAADERLPGGDARDAEPAPPDAPPRQPGDGDDHLPEPERLLQSDPS